ncbi:MAG TPA: hypothetical protein VGG79_07575 [Roseiarcus sp.]
MLPLYISLSAWRHKKVGLTGRLAQLRTTAAMAMVKRPAASKSPVAPLARPAKTGGANRNRPKATQTVAKPKDNPTLRMDRPSSPWTRRLHSLGRALCAKMKQAA